MDPIADMLTRIRNSAMAGHEKMICPSSKVKKGIVSILEREGFIANWQEVDTEEIRLYNIQCCGGNREAEIQGRCDVRISGGSLRGRNLIRRF